MRSYRVPVIAAAAFAVACGAASSVDTAAKVGPTELSVTRLADIMSTAQAPLEKGVARSIAELWMNFQLAGIAAGRGDTLGTDAEIDVGLWSAIENMRVKKLYDQVAPMWDTTSARESVDRYNDGEMLLSARHILITVPEGATPEQVEAARTKAEGIRARATPANFTSLASQSDEPGAGERGGDLGLFQRGQMVPEFETAVLALNPGEISPVVRTSFGFHVIYRKPFSEVGNEFATAMEGRNIAVAESLYLASLENAADVKMSNNSVALTKDIARNPIAFRKDSKTIAEYRGGKLVASRLADWVSAYPPQAQLRPQLVNAADSIVTGFIRQIVRNELLLLQADSAGMTVDADEVANARLALRNNLTTAWASMGLDQASLSSITATGEEREKAIGAKVDEYFDKLVRNEVQFADIPYPAARVMQDKYQFSINEAGLERAVEKARQLRAGADSLGAPATPPVVAPGEMPTGMDSMMTPPGGN